MCRGFDQNGRNDDEVLKFKAFYLRLLFSSSSASVHHDSLTLHFPPRINGGPLEIDGLSVRPDTPAFVTLHPVVVASDDNRAAVYGSRERMRASEGLRFEIYASDVKLLKGIIRKDQIGENWRMDCEAQAEKRILSGADLWVQMEGKSAVVMTEKVEVAEKKKRRNETLAKMSLEEIPEQRESEFDGCCCCCGGGDGDEGESGVDECEMEVEGVRWAVDVGIWVVCLGVGYLVSKASSKKMIRRQNGLF